MKPRPPQTLHKLTANPNPLNPIVPLKQIQYGVYGDLITIYPKPRSIYLRRRISPKREDYQCYGLLHGLRSGASLAGHTCIRLLGSTVWGVGSKGANTVLGFRVYGKWKIEKTLGRK